MATESTFYPERDRRTPPDRRARKTRVHLPERRTGFDRRAHPSPRRAGYLDWVRRLSESPRRVAVLMASFVVLNIADVAFTFRALDRGLRELNPVMAFLLDTSRGGAAFVKIGISVVLAVAGWRYRRYRKVIDVALFGVALMSLVVLYHVFAFFTV